ncbi:Mobile element protein [methanotrophic endosymbiont of Bathymodiolus azoricus (Menez Gwen)]|nr:Mobile element protein [methanotrophic endosymbiont of Bathymodiolus azoricus (Menez Gwen)]
MEERGVNVDHATLNRWVIRYAPTIAAKAHSQKRNTNSSWRMDETGFALKILPFYFEKFPFLIRCLYNIFLQDVGGYSSFVASVNCLVAVYFTPMSCLNSTSVLLSVTFRGYALIIRIQVT